MTHFCSRLIFAGILSAFFFLTTWSGVALGQAGCVSGSNPNLAPTADGWIAHIYQYPVSTSIPAVGTFPSTGEYKGILREEFLPAGQMDFDTHFGGDENDFDATNDDNLSLNITDGTCKTRLSHFGAVFKGRYTIPSNGTYKISITSDDGAVLKINGATIHSTWGRSVYNYTNPSEYYVTKLQNEVLNLEILYYEYTIYNRVSFKIERYFGPGIIASDQRISAVNPDPAPFTSLAPAEFEDESAGIVYQWFFNDVNDPDPSTWTSIPGANAETYDVPSSDAVEGVRYYHRRATSDTTYVSEPVKVDICLVDPLSGQLLEDEWGDKEWIGYVFKGEKNFDLANFQGTVREPAEFTQKFTLSGQTGDQIYYPTTGDYGGCSFFTDHFTIRYKMKIWVTRGVYDFEIWGDDGFRLTIQNEAGEYLGADGTSNYAIENWTTGGATDERKRGLKNDVEIDEGQYLYFTLDYFESRFGAFLSFKATGAPFAVLPLEWGRVWAEACGTDNCLTWETIQEKNTSHFELERSYNGMDWEMFDRSVQAQGNSTELNTYYFTDKRVMASKVYYRIRQVDLDDAFAYSDVMRVDNPHYVKSYLPFPNPTVDKVRFFSVTEVLGVSLVSNDYLLNRHIKFEKLHDDRYEVDLVSLRPGNYVIVVETADGRRDVFKVIKK